MSYIQCTCIIIYTNFLVVHLLHHNNYYVGSVKLSDWLSVLADKYASIYRYRIINKIHIDITSIFFWGLQRYSIANN